MDRKKIFRSWKPERYGDERLRGCYGKSLRARSSHYSARYQKLCTFRVFFFILPTLYASFFFSLFNIEDDFKNELKLFERKVMRKTVVQLKQVK